MTSIEALYFDKYLRDIKEFCIKEGLTKSLHGQMFYLYDQKIYNENMDVVVDRAENGFDDLKESKEN